MARPSSALIEHIYRTAGVYTETTSSDAELVTRYAEAHDERAFSTLMARHGMMVWTICQRILHNTQDVEEAYQTTFLALAHKAKKICGETLVGWLHQVAHRTAVTARRRINSRNKLQKGIQALGLTEATPDRKEKDAYEDLHSEIAKLPEKLRVALVLHYLEGKTQAEVAHILGVKEPSVWSRLARGRAMLEKRLSQQGLLVGATTVSSLLVESASNGAMPPGLVTKTVKAATALREGKLSGGLAKLAQEALTHAPATSPWWKTGWMISVLCLGGLGVGAGGVAWKAGFFGTKADGPPVAKAKELQWAQKKKWEQPRVDFFGDPLPPRALARLGTLRLRHDPSGNVNLMAFLSQGKTLLTAGKRNPPRMWDMATGKLTRQFGSAWPEDIAGAELSADGRLLVCRSGPQSPAEGGSLYIFETMTGKLISTLRGGAADQYALSCALSPDGKFIAAQLYSQIGVWEVATNHQVWIEKKASDFIAFSPDGKTIASADKTTIRLWDAKTGKKTVEIGDSKPDSLVYSPDGKSLLAQYNLLSPHQLALWDVKSGKMRWGIAQADKFKGELWHGLMGLDGGTFSPDGKTIATHGPVFIHLWDVGTGKQLRRWEAGAGRNKLAFSPNVRLLASTGGSTIHFWEVATGKELHPHAAHGHEHDVASAAFLPDGRTVVTGGYDETVRFWDSHTGREQQVLANHCKNAAIMMSLSKTHPILSPNGSILAANFYAGEGLEGFSDLSELSITLDTKMQTNIRLWDTRNGRELRLLNLEGIARQSHLLFSPDGKFLLAAREGFRLGAPAKVHCWEAATGKQLDRSFLGKNPVFCFGGAILATVVADKDDKKDLAFWDVSTGKQVHRAYLGKQNIRMMAASPNDEILAITDDKETALYALSNVRNTSNGPFGTMRIGAPRRIEGPTPTTASIVATFSPDGRLLAFSEDSYSKKGLKLISLFETTSGKKRACFSGHIGPITCLSFSPDGRRLISGSGDTTVILWDVTGRLQDEETSRAASFSQEELEGLWKELGQDDAIRSGQALWNLVAAGPPAALLLEKYLHPIVEVSPEAVNRLIVHLDSHNYRERRDAKGALARIGELCEPALRKALTKNPSVEARASLEGLLYPILAREAPTSEVLQALRGIEVLERIDTPEARRLLKGLASGAAGARLTRAAQSALIRLRAVRVQLAVAKEFQRP